MVACIFGLAQGRRVRYITQAQPVSSFPKLRSDFDRLSAGLALCELAAAIVPHEAPADETFSFVARALAYLEVHENPLVCLIWAEAKLMALAGFRPNLDHCVGTGRPVAYAFEWVSPHAGGLIDESLAARYDDRMRVAAETVYGADRIADEPNPPTKLKRAREVAVMLVAIYEELIDRKLPAHDWIRAENPAIDSDQE